MNSKYQISEKGQAIVFLVLGLVVFLGFVALAIDGGMALADRRHVQNSADAGSLAGGGMAAQYLENKGITRKNWNCTSLQAKNSAVDIAEKYATTRTNANVTVDTALGDKIQVDASCNQSGKYIDVTVEISATTPSNFLQLVFPNALQNQVVAVTRIYPRHPTSPGNAIIALNDAACKGNQNGDVFYINPQDDTTLHVYNGSIHSNGCMKCNGQPNIVVACDYTAEPDCDPAALGSFSTLPPETCNGTWTPPPTSPVDQIDPADFNLGIPNCSAAGAITIAAKDLGKDLGKGGVHLNDPKYLNSRLFCITGELKINGGDELDGTGITIYMVNGDFTINGNAQVNLTAPASKPNPSPAIGGVLIYVPPPEPFICTNHKVQLNGTESSTFIGSIVAPCSQVTLNGTGGNTYQGQIVGWNVEVGGDASLNLTYNENLVTTKPTSMDLYR